jgi:hypothetical protein
MQHLTISLPPTEVAKVEAYLALWQQYSPGIDFSGVITRMIRRWPWVDPDIRIGDAGGD